MARNIRWYINFKSLNCTSCKINIYDNNWPEGTTLGLKGAAEPFSFDEDSSNDILNDVLRYSTGYIRVVQRDSDYDIASIYPTDPFDRYVEVLYGTTVVFKGYIQVQDFSNEQIPNPRVLEFPVTSQLGMLEKNTFSLIMPPTSKTLGQLIDLAIANTSWSYVYVPKNYGYPNPVNLSMKVSSLVVSPWDSEFHHSMNTAPAAKVMRPVTRNYIIEAICKAFGWIAHETADALIFTAFDHEGTYNYYPKGHVGDANYVQESADIPTTQVTLSDYLTMADSKATEMTLHPETGIQISYEGENSDSINYDFQRTYVDQTSPVITMPSYASDPDEVNSLCNLVTVPIINEVSITRVHEFDQNDKLVVGNGICAWNGEVGVLVSFAQTAQNGLLFYMKFYMKKLPGQSYKASFDVKGCHNGYLWKLANDPDISDDDGYVYTTIDFSHDDYIEVNFRYRYTTEHPNLESQALLFITNIRLNVYEDGEPYSQYRYTPTGDSDYIPEVTSPYDIYPAVSTNVDMPISMYRLNDHLIGNSVRSTKVTEYPYMFQPRKLLTAKFKISSLPTFMHAKLWSFENKKWRIIAQKFNLWDDEVELYMQNSSTL